MTRRVALPLLAVVIAVAGAAPVSAAPVTKLVSKTSEGVPADDNSYEPDVSARGRFVAFGSDATNLPGDDEYADVFIRDRETGTTRLVSKTSEGVPADGDSYDPSISGSGRFVAFYSDAPNLPGRDAYRDVYIHDRETGTTRLVSKTSDGVSANGDSSGPSISRSGRFVAFHSDATNLPGRDVYADVYVHDRESGTTRLVSKSSEGVPANGDSFGPDVSARGRFVAFYSHANNLPGADLTFDVLVHDRETGTTRLVSKTSGGTPANANSSFSDVSASGRFVIFGSIATNLPGRDAYNDVFVHDREDGRTRLVSKTSGGVPANGSSFQPSISGTGRLAAFYSEATNLPGDDASDDVYTHGPLG
jgi:Tol biopolymer transport system component